MEPTIKQFDKRSAKQLMELLAVLKAAQWIHQSGYWVAGGPAHYGLHKMFKHIINPIEKHLDELGNRITVKFGDKTVDPIRIDRMSRKYSKEAISHDNPIKRSLAIERMVVRRCEKTIKMLKRAGMLSSGLDSLISQIAEDHEDAVYHLNKSSRK